jgi:hypothetical protein
MTGSLFLPSSTLSLPPHLLASRQILFCSYEESINNNEDQGFLLVEVRIAI